MLLLQADATPDPFPTRGRPPGARNKATRQLKAFLQSVFEEAWFTNAEGRAALVAGIRDLTLEPRTLMVLMHYAFDMPSRAVDVHHQGTVVSLAQIISGSALAYLDELEAEDDDDDNRRPSSQRSSHDRSDPHVLRPQPATHEIPREAIPVKCSTVGHVPPQSTQCRRRRNAPSACRGRLSTTRLVVEAHHGQGGFTTSLTTRLRATVATGHRPPAVPHGTRHR